MGAPRAPTTPRTWSLHLSDCRMVFLASTRKVLGQPLHVAPFMGPVFGRLVSPAWAGHASTALAMH